MSPFHVSVRGRQDYWAASRSRKRPKGFYLWCAFEYLQLSLQFGTLPDKLAKLLH
jgi:hypothetical protein